MKLLFDGADINQIKEMDAIYPLDGFTSNPTSLKKTGRPPYEVLLEIREYIKERELHVQVVATEVADMIKEAAVIRNILGADTYVKIPVDRNGLIAIAKLKEAGVKVTATAIYEPMQAFLAAKAGADYVAPYVNRIETISNNGVETACLIADILKINNLNSQVLSASFKRKDQVLALIAHGIDSITVSYDLLNTLLDNDDVSKAIKAFVKDFEDLAGPNKTMFDQ
ncbi:MAG: transaldolase family protein [Erysipelotrichaceae bacterium]|nr:transaldolase family protein [Erysipelotrichaceae bacterium]